MVDKALNQIEEGSDQMNQIQQDPSLKVRVPQNIEGTPLYSFLKDFDRVQAAKLLDKRRVDQIVDSAERNGGEVKFLIGKQYAEEIVDVMTNVKTSQI